MKNDQNNYFNLEDIQSKAGDVLGENFGKEISNVMPKRGPCVDVYKTENEVVVVVEIPGICSSQYVNLRLKGFKLLIFGKIPWTYPVSKDNILQKERFIGNFKREINLPHDILPSEVINAQFKNGLIEIHIPRVSTQDEKEISINFIE